MAAVRACERITAFSAGVVTRPPCALLSLREARKDASSKISLLQVQECRPAAARAEQGASQAATAASGRAGEGRERTLAATRPAAETT